MSEAKGEQESTETLSFRCDCERCRLTRGRKGRFAPQDDMSEVESNKNTSLALGERVSAGQERGQSEALTTMRSLRRFAPQDDMNFEGNGKGTQ